MMSLQLRVGILRRFICSVGVCFISKAMHMAAFVMSSAYLIKGVGISH